MVGLGELWGSWQGIDWILTAQNRSRMRVAESSLPPYLDDNFVGGGLAHVVHAERGHRGARHGLNFLFVVGSLTGMG